MNYIVVLILLILSACALYFAFKNFVCNKSEHFLTEYTKNFKEYEKILISDYTDLSINVYDIFPDILKHNESCVANSSADLRKFFIGIGYEIYSFSFLLNKLSLIDFNLYGIFENNFENIKRTSFYKGEPFREEDFKS